jgi:hypothetical protein
MASPDVQPNRWNTPIIVKQYSGSRVVATTHFSDLQVAYYAVKSCMGEWDNENFSELPTFLEFAQDMDEIWAEQMTGIVLTESDTMRFDVYYNVNGMYGHRNNPEDSEEEEWEQPQPEEQSQHQHNHNAASNAVVVPQLDLATVNMMANINRAINAINSNNSG